MDQEDEASRRFLKASDNHFNPVSQDSEEHLETEDDCPPSGNPQQFLQNAIVDALHDCVDIIPRICVSATDINISGRARMIDLGKDFTGIAACDYKMALLQSGRLPQAFSLEYDLRRLRESPLLRDSSGNSEKRLLQYIWRLLLADPVCRRLRDWTLDLTGQNSESAPASRVAVAYTDSTSKVVELHTTFLRLAFWSYYGAVAEDVEYGLWKSRQETRDSKRVFHTLESRSIFDDANRRKPYEEICQLELRSFVLFVASLLGHELGHAQFSLATQNFRTNSEEELACDAFSREICTRVFGAFSLEFRDKLEVKALKEGSWDVLNFHSGEALEKRLLEMRARKGSM